MPDIINVIIPDVDSLIAPPIDVIMPDLNPEFDVLTDFLATDQTVVVQPAALQLEDFTAPSIEVTFEGPAGPPSTVPGPPGEQGIQGPPGPQGIQGPAGTGLDPYVFVQNTPSDTWLIGSLPMSYGTVTIVDSAGNVVLGEIDYVDANTIRISFSAPFAGTAYVI